MSKKGDCVAEGKVQKPNVPPSVWHREISILFPVQNWGASSETSRWQDKNQINKKNQMSKMFCCHKKMQLRKCNVLPQDAVGPVCVCDNAVSVPTCVRLRCGNSLSHKCWWLGEYLGESITLHFLFFHGTPPGSFYGSLLKTGYQTRLLMWPQKDALMFFYSFFVVLMSWGILAGLHEEILYPFSE